jgi:hypothetical protein
LAVTRLKGFLGGQNTSQDPPVDFPVQNELNLTKKGGVNPRLGVLTRVVGPNNLVNLVNIDLALT